VKDVDLPNGWAAAGLGEIAGVNPRTFRTDVTPDTEVSFVPMAAVEAGSGLLDASDIQLWGDLARRSYTRFAEGDVLFAKITPCMENGKFALAKGLKNGAGVGSTEFHVIRCPSGLHTKYILYFLLQESVRKRARAVMAGAVGQMRVPADFLFELAIPVPPAAEQERIVAEIEKQLTRLDAAVAALQRVRANVKRYRGAVLEAACEGTLVPQHASDEPAERLVERILTERRANVETSPAAKRKELKRAWDDEQQALDTSELPTLPKGWCWARAEQICEAVSSGSTPSADKMYSGSGEVPFIKVYNLTFDGTLDFGTKPTFITKHTHLNQLGRSRSFPGYVLMNIVGPPLGKVSITPDFHPEWNINQAIVSFRPSKGLDHKYLSYALLSGDTQRRLQRTAKATAGQFNLAVTTCRRLALPVPPVSEQRLIVAEVERRLSVVESLEDAVENGLKRAERLRQSVLRRAFEGRLAPQDPDDEPASVLLERIREERQKDPAFVRARVRRVRRERVQLPLGGMGHDEKRQREREPLPADRPEAVELLQHPAG